MGKLVACINVTLDGVMQGPARPDEDPRGGFSHGGWGAPYAAMSHAGSVFASAGALLLGRRTYMDFAHVWPSRPDSPHTAWLTAIPKYVASRTLDAPLPWENSTLLGGDMESAVARLKGDVEKNILLMGSGDLMQSLMRAGLVDEYVLLVHPIVLGSGQRLFVDGGAELSLELIESAATPTGVIISTYRPRR